FYISTLNAVNGPLRGTTAGALGHGHLNATIIAGATPYGPLDSLFYNYGIGVAPRANILSIPRNRLGYTGTDEQVYNDSVVTPGPNGAGALISNNSWGNGTNGNVYTSTVEGRFDGYVQDASLDIGIDPISLIFSAGNDGANGLTRPKVAKNLISVGNSESLRTDLGGTDANNIDDLSSDSSRGPTADGRIKPDVVAPGTAITGGRSGTDSLRGNIGTAHRWSSGTSHSAAHVTGMAALFANWWYVSQFVRPSPALIKAAIINSAIDMNGANSSASIPNGSEGWGRPNLKNMLNTGVGMKHHNDDLVGLSAPGQGFFINGSVADANKPVRVTLVWTDPPGLADPALVNNLDLKVTVDGVVYKGNVFSNGFSVPGGTADNRNNVENVFLPAGTPVGRGLQVEVTATALNGDGILNNGDATDQAFSVVIYNYSSQAAPAFYNVSGQVRSANGRGIGMARVRFTNSQGITREVFSNPLGYYSFTQLAGNQNYTVNVVSKRYTFAQRVEPVNGNISNLNITSTGTP
ncbi:MAG: S8 family serine peptidase, partial [Acidobacteria bacterium]|nr:S8 family serine peptidase [Acidobacteriota bacterium]